MATPLKNYVVRFMYYTDNRWEFVAKDQPNELAALSAAYTEASRLGHAPWIEGHKGFHIDIWEY